MTVTKRPETGQENSLFPDADAVPFEEALKRLEAVVARLEAGDLPLEESLAAFEEGVALTKLCSQRLSEAERRVNILLRNAEGVVEERPFEGDGGAADLDNGEGKKE